MLSIESFMHPIREDAPSGQNLRYDRIVDQIAEARAEEDETLPTGNWGRQAKRADVSQVITLAEEALRSRSKDLWFAAWLGEASIRQEKWKVVPGSLSLLLRLQEEFWDSLYPEIEEGDPGLRAAPLQWAMARYAALVYEMPVTAEAFGFHVYQAARAIGYQADVDQGEVTRAARAAAIEQGRLTPEDLDVAFAATSKEFYASLAALLAETREALQSLYTFCEARYGEDGPSFVKIRTAVDEVQNLIVSLLRRKRESDPDPVSLPLEAEDVSEPSEENDRLDEEHFRDEAMASPVKNEPTDDDIRGLSEENPAVRQDPLNTSLALDSWDSAIAQVQRCAKFMLTQQPDNPSSYLLLNAIMYPNAMNDDPRSTAPSSETRLLLKQTSEEGDWNSLLRRSMEALATSSGIKWFDLHRYLWHASRELGYQALTDCVREHVRAMYRSSDDALAELVFEDGTPTASGGTLQWIERDVLDTAETEAEAKTSLQGSVDESPALTAPVSLDVSTEPRSTEQEFLALAEELAAGGNLQEALRVLTDDTIVANGRILFQRRLQIARLCLDAGQSLIAEPLLWRLLGEADERHLGHWEGPRMVASVLMLLLRSADANGASNDMRAESRNVIFARLCEIDTAAALSHERGIRHE